VCRIRTVRGKPVFSPIRLMSGEECRVLSTSLSAYHPARHPQFRPRMLKKTLKQSNNLPRTDGYALFSQHRPLAPWAPHQPVATWPTGRASWSGTGRISPTQEPHSAFRTSKLHTIKVFGFLDNIMPNPQPPDPERGQRRVRSRRSHCWDCVLVFLGCGRDALHNRGGCHMGPRRRGASGCQVGKEARTLSTRPKFALRVIREAGEGRGTDCLVGLGVGALHFSFLHCASPLRFIAA